MIYILFGPTGSGKTSLSELLCEKENGELIAADSRQIYKYMPIGTGLSDNKLHTHLTSFLPPSEKYSVSLWQKAAYYLIETIKTNGKNPIIVGGTGLYIDSLLYDREYGNNVSPLLNLEFKLLTPEISREQVYENINKRVEKMFQDGFVNEVKMLIEMGYGNCKSVNGAGYIEIKEYLDNEGKTLMDFPEIVNSLMPVRQPILDLDTCIEKVKIAYRNYAKRQYTWFRKYYHDFNVEKISKDLI